MPDRVLSWIFEGRDRISPAAKSASASVSGLAGAVDKAKDAELRSRAATLGSERAALAVADARRRATLVTKNANSTEDQRRRAVLSVESAEVRHAQSLRKVDAANLALVASTKAASKGSEEAAGTAGALGGTLRTAVAAGAVFAGAKILSFGLDAAHAASDMNESVSKSAVVFGAGQDAVLKFASTAAKSLGISRQEAIETTATFGNFFEALGIGAPKAETMSIRIVKLASDLASFNNQDPGEVLESLRSGLAGEVEPLRKFGIDLNDAALKAEAARLGLGKIGPTLTAGQKAQAAYSLILKQTTTAQGDFARTSSGAANQARILSAQFKDFQASAGKTFLPILLAVERGANSLLGPLGDLVTKMQDLPAGVKAGAVAFGGLVLSAVALRKALSVVSFSAIRAGLVGMLAAVNPLNVVLAAGAVAFGLYAQKQADTRRRTDELADALRQSNGVLTESVRATAAHQLEQQGALKAAEDFGLTAKVATDALLGNKDALMLVNGVLDTYQQQTREVNREGGEAFIQHNQLGKSFGILSTAVRGGSNSLQEQIGALKREAEAAGASKATVQALGSAQSQVAKPAVVKAIDVFGQTIDTSTGKVLEAKTAIEKLVYQYDVLTGKNISADEATINFEDSLTTLSQSVRDNGKGLGFNSTKARENRSAFIDAAKAAQNLSEKIGDQKGYNAGRVSMIESRKRLAELGEKLHLSSSQVQVLIDKYLKVPAQKKTAVTAPGAVTSKAHVDHLRQSLDKIPPQSVANVLVKIRGQDVTGSFTYSSPGTRTLARAAGGWVPGASPSDTADNIPARLTADEFVVRRPSARKIRARAPGLLEALNAGQVDVGGDQSGMRLRYGRALAFGAGGSVPGVQSWMRAQDPKPYVWGAVGPGAYDCSGFAGSAYGLLTGKGAYHRYFTTASSFSALGFRRGTGVFTIGVNPGRHMAFSVGGLRGEAQSSATGIFVGQGATPTSRFSQQWHLPGVGGLTARQIHESVALVRPAVVAGIMRDLGVRTADQGAVLRPGLNLLDNRTGGLERLARVDSPGNTYNITVSVPPTGNPAEVGREVVAAIRAYEQRSGKSWRAV